jgi:hypothetical protein
MTPENPIRIGDKEYAYEDMPARAQTLIVHINSIDKQLNQLDAQMDLMQIAREGCYAKLTQAMEHYDGEEETDPAGRL